MVDTQELYEERRAAEKIRSMYDYYKKNHLKDPPGVMELEDAAATVSFLFEQIESLTAQLDTLREAAMDAKRVLADYAGKGQLSDDLYCNTKGIIPAGHASRAYLRIKAALNQQEEKI